MSGKCKCLSPTDTSVISREAKSQVVGVARSMVILFCSGFDCELCVYLECCGWSGCALCKGYVSFSFVGSHVEVSGGIGFHLKLPIRT